MRIKLFNIAVFRSASIRSRSCLQGFDAVFMVGVLLLVYLVGSVAFYPFTIFCVIELVTLLVAVIHARRPSLGWFSGSVR